MGGSVSYATSPFFAIGKLFKIFQAIVRNFNCSVFTSTINLGSKEFQNRSFPDGTSTWNFG